jgi:hypothetical protein
LLIGELLTEGVAFRCNSTKHAVGRSQLLRHYAEVAIQCANRGVIVGGFHRRRRCLLFGSRAPGGAGPAPGVLAREDDDGSLGCSGRRIGRRRGISRQFVFIVGGGIALCGALLGERRSRAATFLRTSYPARFPIEIRNFARLDHLARVAGPRSDRFAHRRLDVV